MCLCVNIDPAPHPPTCPTDPLSVDKHLKMIREVTWDVRAHWYDIGVELNVGDGTLKVGYSV